MKDKKLNNLLGMEDYSEKDLTKKAKVTKRTEVAKDVLEGKEFTGKDVFGEKSKEKAHAGIADHTGLKKLNNLISLDQYTEKQALKDAKKTKRTDVAKDVLQEKKEEKKGLTAKQKKLPEAIQKAILKKQCK
jgi:hypothetical protein